jgi:replicative DNA helicase
MDFTDMSDQVPPQDVDIEVEILGGILLDPNAIGRVSNILPTEAFYLRSHQDIYQGMVQLDRQGKPTDLLTVVSWLKDHNLLEKIGGRNKLAELVERAVSAINIDSFAEVVVEKYQRRLLIKAAEEIKQVAHDTTVEIEEVVNRAEEKVFSIVRRNKEDEGLIHVKETLAKSFLDIESKSQGILNPAISSGFVDLDELINNGFQRTDLVIIAGRPAMGKSAFALNIATNIANAGFPVAIFSLEMSREQLVMRMLSSQSHIESKFLKTGRIAQNQWEGLAQSIGVLQDIPIHIDDTANITVAEMRGKLRQLDMQSEFGLGLVVIDYLQLMEGGGDNRVQEISKITRGLKVLAREINVPVIALSQLSRAVETRTNKRPMLSDLKESGSIEQDADMVLMLYRDEYYNPDSPDRAITEVIISKHRHGATGTTKLLFDAQFTQFKNLARNAKY